MVQERVGGRNFGKTRCQIGGKKGGRVVQKGTTATKAGKKMAQMQRKEGGTGKGEVRGGCHWWNSWGTWWNFDS